MSQAIRPATRHPASVWARSRPRQSARLERREIAGGTRPAAGDAGSVANGRLGHWRFAVSTRRRGDRWLATVPPRRAKGGAGSSGRRSRPRPAAPRRPGRPGRPPASSGRRPTGPPGQTCFNSRPASRPEGQEDRRLHQPGQARPGQGRRDRCETVSHGSTPFACLSSVLPPFSISR